MKYFLQAFCVVCVIGFAALAGAPGYSIPTTNSASLTTGSVTLSPTLGAELAPALTAGNWTVGSGWESPIVGPGLIKNADGTGTQTPSAATNITAGATYKVVITLSAASVASASYTLGATTGGSSLAAATTYTDYVTTTTTGKLIITPTNTSRFTISAISIKQVTLGGIVGTTTNDLAVAGTVGEYFSSYIAVGSPQGMSNGVAMNVTSLVLTAGDWDVQGNVNLINTGSSVTATQCGLSSTSATLPVDGSEVSSGILGTTVSETDGVTLPRKRFSLASQTTVYLVAKATFSIGTFGSYGGITARRVR